ncbi:thiamine pyrophosphate-dependent enzyme [Amylibacter sp.]|nr:thiamine pyrophosphate-dependent enzyme [Amylibacter sp.]
MSKKDYNSSEEFYSQALEIRKFEELLLELFSLGKIRGTTHTCIGQETTAVGVLSALGEKSVVISNHRGHGHFIAKTKDPKVLLLEILGSSKGLCGGWGGSQHLCVPNEFYSNGILGGTVPQALGLAMAQKIKNTKKITVVFLGDGAFGQGVVYETLNLSSVLNAPILFVLDNNKMAQSTKSEGTTAGSYEARFNAFDIECETIEVPDVDKIFRTTQKMVNKIQAESKPKALIINSIRLGPHSKGDDTREKDEMDELWKNDPLKRLKYSISSKDLQKIEEQVITKIEKLKNLALANVDNDLKGDYITQNITSNMPLKLYELTNLIADLNSGPVLKRLNSCLHNIMENNPKAYLIGEDILDPYGGAFKATAGLSDKFSERVWTMPICENGFVGMSGGMALGGIFPIVEIMFGDFLTVCCDQIINYIAKYRQMYGWQVEMPMIIRTPMGGGRGYGPTHSQSIEKCFAGIPGLQIFALSPYHSIEFIYSAAEKSKDPTLIIENKIDYGRRIKISEDGKIEEFSCRYKTNEITLIFEASLTEFESHDAIIYTYGGMTKLSMDAAMDLLLEHDLSIKIISTSCIYPLPVDFISNLDNGIAKLTVEESSSVYGFGSEVGALIKESGCKSSFVRIGSKSVQIPSSMTLEENVLPSKNRIIKAVLNLFN